MERSRKISRSSLSSIYVSPAHRCAPFFGLFDPLRSRAVPQQGRI